MINFERLEAALSALENYSQGDMDGIMVLVSRQAIHEVTEATKALMFAYQFVEQVNPDALPPSSPEAAAYGGGFDPYNP